MKYFLKLDDMSQEEKQLLLQDLCGRLPYNVMIHYHWEKKDDNDSAIVEDRVLDFSDVDTLNYTIKEPQDHWCIIDWKPYLRSLSSMTEEEKEELKNLFDAEEVTTDSICYLEGGTLEEYLSYISYSFCSKIIDWLIKNHFDFRGLIEKGLAIEVTEVNNPYK